MTTPQPDLQQLIDAAVRRVLADLVSPGVAGALKDRRGDGLPGSGPGQGSPTPDLTTAPGERRHPAARVSTVRIADDRDLDAFVRHVLSLFENPKNRMDLRSGRLRFQLKNATGSGVSGRFRSIEAGAVTERHVQEAGAAVEGIRLGPRAVLTPLARERARALGITIIKERA
ncbi:hypothetical protein HNR19_000320 [Nocardioides thalensis]|uniref:Uncharacterized protein n=1 Tax=Nocardioides thalensis TaxID=1914755 RepID=A0A853BYQ6_9ACTN|nr:hypothetical protein [Nocardioides thalensis]NYI99621.1 hypothetical protein [Nocardioides thalensis]